VTAAEDRNMQREIHRTVHGVSRPAPPPAKPNEVPDRAQPGQRIEKPALAAHISLPAHEFVYSVKFICGARTECACECAPVQPGHYSTEVSIHNYGPKEIEVRKQFVTVVLAGAPVGREPRVKGATAEDRILLPPQSATMEDCCRIAAILFGDDPPSPIPLTIGFLEITANEPLAVTAVYTGSSPNSGGVSIVVNQIAALRR
jgi:hypothetical protein